MNILVKRKLLNFGIFTLGTFLLECVSFSFMGWGFLPVYFFLDLLIIAILGSLVFLLKNTLFDKIYLPIVMFASACLFCLNANYYVATGSIFTIQDFQFIFKIDKVIGTAIKFLNAPILITEFAIFAVLTFAILFINIKLKIKTNQKIKKDKGMLIISILAISNVTFIYPTTLFVTSGYEKYALNNQLIENVNLSKNYNYQRLGMFSYYIKDIACTYFSSGAVNEKTFTDYCHSSKTETNDFTGLLKGYNVITIMIETGARMMLNKTLTPNLWYLTQNGVDCTHNYTKNKTNISEYIGICGNCTANGLTPDRFNISVPFSLPNLLPNYDSIYCHDVGNTNDIYSRRSFIPKLGFKTSIMHNLLYPSQEDWVWDNYSYDSETTANLINLIKSISNPFYLFYTTLTMHGSYKINPVGEKYYAKLKMLYESNLNAAEQSGEWVNPLKDTPSEYLVHNYMLKVMDFDKGLGYLIDYLIEFNKLNKTLIVLYGDHDVYYAADDDTTPISFLVYNKNNREEIALYNTMLTLFNPKLNEKYFSKYGKHTFDEFTSVNNITSTICDLLGLKYNDNLYLGKSIFNIQNNEIGMFYSYELSVCMNENYLARNGNEVSKVFFDNDTKNEFKTKCNETIIKLLNLNYIYSTNFFSNHDYIDYL